MNVAAVDIGTNSVRLLITDERGSRARARACRSRGSVKAST